MKRTVPALLAVLFAAGIAAAAALFSQDSDQARAIDAKVRAFLDKMRYSWADLNVPASDGQLLYDLVLKHGYKRALEIGTSTGHSGVWIAWALSKTGGKLITVEIDEGRRRQALAHFKEAGLEDVIDSRLGDAHKIVPELPGTFDFVFSDADKDWYINYAKAVIPKLEPGGCLAAHNISPRGRFFGGGNADYWAYVKGLPDFETSMAADGSSLAVSFKKKGT